MDNSGLLHALLLDGAGGAKALAPEEIRSWVPENGVLWLHFNFTMTGAVNWIDSEKQLDCLSKDFLVAEETRPRVMTINNELHLALRGVNLNPGSDPEDMIGVRIWACESKIITTIRRDLLSISDMVKDLGMNAGPKDSSEFIVELADKLIIRMGPTVEGLEELLAELEEQIIDTGDAASRRQLSDIRRESIVLRRYLSPQREAMYRLYDEKISWFQQEERMHSREVTDHLLRYIENLDSIRERATVIHEELVSNLSEQLNKRMYVLALVSVIFMPLGLLTGLFGINVGGIPGVENKFAFTYFTVILILIALIILFFFKRKRWM